jgi:hypothetical protein
MNFDQQSSVNSSNKHVRPIEDRSAMIKSEIDVLHKNMAERERKILQDMSNFSAKRGQESTTCTKASMKENTLDKEVKEEVKKAIEYQEGMLSRESVDCFGVPDIRVDSHDLRRAKGALWIKRWTKEPLARNMLPDHFPQ